MSHILHKKNGYYYVYPKFIQNILLWLALALSQSGSAHPRAFGNEGYMGNHISIGSKNGQEIDIHETVYSTKQSNEKHILISNRVHCNYTVGPNNILQSNNCNLHHLAQIIWDDISCPTCFIGGSNKSINLVKKGKSHRMLNIGNKEACQLINTILQAKFDKDDVYHTKL